MNNAPAELTARHEAQLTIMAAALRHEGREMRLVEANDDNPVPTLLVALGADEEARDRTLAMSLMPFGDEGLAATDLLQFYVQLPFDLTADTRTDVMAATADVNAAMAVGHFAVRKSELFYRYVMATPNNGTVDDELLVELVNLIDFHQEHFGDYLEGVATGEIAVQVLAEVIAQSE